jgi:hypothetical protein
MFAIEDPDVSIAKLDKVRTIAVRDACTGVHVSARVDFAFTRRVAQGFSSGQMAQAKKMDLDIEQRSKGVLLCVF